MVVITERWMYIERLHTRLIPVLTGNSLLQQFKKWIITVNPRTYGEQVHWQTCKGSIHDFKLYKDTCPDWLPENTNYLADSGYQGLAKRHNQTFTPFKKPRGSQLLEICKQANHYLAKFCIVVEHKIGLIKLFKIVAHKYRNRRQRYDLRMKLFAGIINSELRI